MLSRRRSTRSRGRWGRVQRSAGRSEDRLGSACAPPPSRLQLGQACHPWSAPGPADPDRRGRPCREPPSAQARRAATSARVLPVRQRPGQASLARAEGTGRALGTGREARAAVVRGYCCPAPQPRPPAQAAALRSPRKLCESRSLAWRLIRPRRPPRCNGGEVGPQIGDGAFARTGRERPEIALVKTQTGWKIGLPPPVSSTSLDCSKADALEPTSQVRESTQRLKISERSLLCRGRRGWW